MKSKTSPQKVRVTFDKNDVSELFFMLRNRGECDTKKKLLNALTKLSPKTAELIEVNKLK